MEKLKVIHGSGYATNYVVNSLLDSACIFYGDKYKNIVYDVVANTKFIELNDMNELNDVWDMPVPSNYLNMKALHATVRENNECYGKKQNYVIWTPTSNDYPFDCHVIAHELYGHAVCERLNQNIIYNNRVYARNGVALLDEITGEVKYELINEGMIEYIANSIIDIKGNIKKYSSDSYKLSEFCAKYLFNLHGKEEMIKTMVEYDYDILNYFNEYNKLERILKKALNSNNLDKYKNKSKKQLKKLRKLYEENR